MLTMMMSNCVMILNGSCHMIDQNVYIYNLCAGESSSPAWKSTRIPPKNGPFLSQTQWLRAQPPRMSWSLAPSQGPGETVLTVFSGYNSVTRILSYFHSGTTTSHIPLPVIVWLWSHSFQPFWLSKHFFILLTTPGYDTPHTAMSSALPWHSPDLQFRTTSGSHPDQHPGHLWNLWKKAWIPLHITSHSQSLHDWSPSFHFFPLLSPHPHFTHTQASLHMAATYYTIAIWILGELDEC